jgi:hypothetical protein
MRAPASSGTSLDDAVPGVVLTNARDALVFWTNTLSLPAGIAALADVVDAAIATVALVGLMLGD